MAKKRMNVSLLRLNLFSIFRTKFGEMSFGKRMIQTLAFDGKNNLEQIWETKKEVIHERETC